MRRLVPLLALGLAACAGGPGPADDFTVEVHDSVPVTLTMPVSKPFRLDLADRTIQLGVAEILDSRCPRGVTCVQAGDVRVALWLEIRRPDGTRPDIERVEMLAPLPEPVFASAAGLYWRLISVEPHPAKGDFITTDRYRATVFVTDEPPPPPPPEEEDGGP